MSEHDANKALTDTARLRLFDPLEQTQFMPIFDRRYRQAEARGMYADGMYRLGYVPAVGMPV